MVNKRRSITALPRRVLARIAARSFFLQASWNYEQLQSLGLLFALSPALQRFYDRDELTLAYRRHLRYFNTHPYLASALIGALLNLEETRAAGQEEEIGINEFKSAVTAPCAAMGDGFFWGAVRPAASVAGLFLAFKGSLWGPVLFLLVFNLPHFWWRTSGLLRGYRRGFRVVADIQRYRFPDLAVRLKQVLVILLGVLAAMLVGDRLHGWGLPIWWGLGAVPLIVLLGTLVRRRFSPLLMLYAMLLMLLWFHR
jgi:PTS system mannose-specific IID component